MKPTSPHRPGADRAEPWYTHRWPWLLMLGPFIVVVAAMYTGWVAFSRPDALVVDDYYKQGKAINQDLRRDRAAVRLGLRVDAKYDAAAGRLTGTIASLGAPLAEAIELKLIHSTLPGLDIYLNTRSDIRGNFAIALPMLERARWQVLVQDHGREWRLSGVWTWPQQAEIQIRAATAQLDGQGGDR